MNKRKILFFIITLLAIVIFVWTPSDAFAQAMGAKDKPIKGKVTRDDVAAYFGKVKPSEQKAAQKRARNLGLLPGIAGRTAQVPGPSGAPKTN